MGHMESKRDKYKKHTGEISEKAKKPFLARLRKRLFQGRKRSTTSISNKSYKSHRSHLRQKRDNYSIHNQRKNSKESRRDEKRSEKEKKISERIKRKSNKICTTMSKSAKQQRKIGMRNNVTKTKSHKSTKTQTKVHSTISYPTIHRKTDVKIKKYQSKQNENIAVKSLRKTFQSLTKIPAWSPSSSSRQSLRNVRKRMTAFFSRPLTDATEVPEILLRSADEKFPSKREIERYEIEMKDKSDKITPLKKSISTVSNKDNEGKLFDEDGLPFWNKLSKIQKDSKNNREDISDEDLPMDSEVLLEVQSGQRKLVKMPEIR
ncbi:unnamed protein product [Cercopithifilaria johnstoni]|uniref:Uncharacterized protein n=1 Tax=Cercopithifilaria johnstoni TaxID=2874296 RepID=A0A8J2M1Q9_9BILA|nr:unnamed protein product [Cercopithifilaria johnstoni]